MQSLSVFEREVLVKNWLGFFTRLKLNPIVKEGGAKIQLPDFHVRFPQCLTVIPVPTVVDNNYFEQFFNPEYSAWTPFVVVDGLADAKAYPLFTGNGNGQIGSVLAIFAFSSSLKEKKMFTNPNKIDLITRKIEPSVLQKHGKELLDAIWWANNAVGDIIEDATFKPTVVDREDGSEESVELMLRESYYKRIVLLNKLQQGHFSESELVYLEKLLLPR